MAKPPKVPVWREVRAGDTWHRYTCWRAKVNRWGLEVRVYRPHNQNEDRYCFTAEHKATETFFNSAWPGVQVQWKTLEAAKAAAVEGAMESESFAKIKARGKDKAGA
jgi:hypothetical protein